MPSSPRQVRGVYTSPKQDYFLRLLDHIDVVRGGGGALTILRNRCSWASSIAVRTLGSITATKVVLHLSIEFLLGLLGTGIPAATGTTTAISVLVSALPTGPRAPAAALTAARRRRGPGSSTLPGNVPVDSFPSSLLLGVLALGRVRTRPITRRCDPLRQRSAGHDGVIKGIARAQESKSNRLA